MSQEKLRAIIVKAKPVSDSLHVDTLLENGELGLFNIPGILKSNKRSTFHYAPGAVYEFIFRQAGSGRVIPRSAELVFSPFRDNQDYARLAAVAEIIQTAEFIRPGPESSDLFALLLSAILKLPLQAPGLDAHLDQFYWNFLEVWGLAAAPDSGSTYVAYDLHSGFLTAKELAERPAGDFVLPYPWRGAEARKLIRRFLGQI